MSVISEVAKAAGFGMMNKENPNHGPDGKFSSGEGGGSSRSIPFKGLHTGEEAGGGFHRDSAETEGGYHTTIYNHKDNGKDVMVTKNPDGSHDVTYSHDKNPSVHGTKSFKDEAGASKFIQQKFGIKH